MTNINTLAKRVERLENGKRKPAHNIKISYKFNKWVVNKDGAEFDTLRDAVKHIKSRYSAANVQVNQTDYILSKMSTPELRKVAELDDPELEEKDDIFQVFTRPCDQLAEVEKAYPTMHFEIVIEDSYKELKA